MPSVTDCEREIEELHALFVRWYRGRADRDEFGRVERALGGSFELVSPDGLVSDRETVLAGVREQYDSRTGFDIEIRNLEAVDIEGDRALVRYEEWQSGQTGPGATGRLSTALFAPPGTTDGDPGTRPAARWLYLQETWLDGPEP
jgi:Uncharacterized protein conserved in bacteria